MSTGTPDHQTARTLSGDLLSVSAAARMLGVSPSSLRAWAAAGRVPHIRTPGGHRRFRREELVEWLAQHGGEPPAQATRTQELVPTRIDPMPALADEMARVQPQLVTVFEEELARARMGGAHRASAARQTRVTGTLETLTQGIRSGDLANTLREAEWEGFRYGAAGQHGDVPVTEALALRRAVDRVLEASFVDAPDQQRTIERALDRLAIRVAAGYAEGVKVRLRARSE